MFQHMFTSMNELLDQIIKQYPNANEQEKSQFDEQMKELKKASDICIEQWMEFEEKFSDYKEQQENGLTEISSCSHEASTCNSFDLTIPDETEFMISKGQGYYKLFMFPQAASQFQAAILITPECNLARLYLGMTQMHLQNWSEAQRHFQLLILLSDFPKWLALGYNALGCIHAVRMNLALAEQLFKKAHQVYPSFTDSLSNLKSCQETPEQLSLYFGSTELCCL